MQTAKIKAGETYAMRRKEGLVRFRVTAVITERTTHKTESMAEGHVIEDFVDGKPLAPRRVDPQDLIGLYTEQAELVARREQEQAVAAAKAKEEARLANEDRLMLYAFVGLPVPKVKPDAYDQPFKLSGYSNRRIRIEDEGVDLILTKVRSLQAVDRDPGDPSPELIAAAQAQWKREGKV